MIMLLLFPREQLLWAVFGLVSGMLAALAYLQVRHLGMLGEHEDRVVFIFCITGTVGGAIACLIRAHLPGSGDLTLLWQDERFDQFELDRRCWRLGLEYLRKHPEDIPRLLWNKFERFWSINIRNESWERWLFILLDQVPVLIALLGFLVSFGIRRPPHILCVLFLAVQVSSLIFFANTRMRVGIAPAVVIYAAFGAVFVYRWIKKIFPERNAI